MEYMLPSESDSRPSAAPPLSPWSITVASISLLLESLFARASVETLYNLRLSSGQCYNLDPSELIAIPSTPMLAPCFTKPSCWCSKKGLPPQEEESFSYLWVLLKGDR